MTHSTRYQECDCIVKELDWYEECIVFLKTFVDKIVRVQDSSTTGIKKSNEQKGRKAVISTDPTSINKNLAPNAQAFCKMKT